MEYCGPRALPHSQFLAWSPDDQDKALAWLVHDRVRCSNCGTFADEWVTIVTDPLTGRPIIDPETNQPVERLRIPPPYEAWPRTCHGCEEIDRYNAHMEKHGGARHGTQVILIESNPDDYARHLWTEE